MYCGYHCLTSPVAYIATLPRDPYKDPEVGRLYGWLFSWARCPDGYTGDRGAYIFGFNNPVNPFYHRDQVVWQLISNGPNMKSDYYDYPSYDATNGTVSRGMLYRWGP